MNQKIYTGDATHFFFFLRRKIMSDPQRAPQAIFYSDESSESRKVRKILQKSGIIFDEINEHGEDNGSLNGYKPPLIRAREGEFEGVKRIKDFVNFILSTKH